MGSFIDSSGKVSTQKGSRNRAAAAVEEDSQASTLLSQEVELKRTEWTDEKHSLYLKSMEASFVDQLYDSLDSFGWHSGKEMLSDSEPSKQKQAILRTSSGQYKIFQGGYWTRMKFGRVEAEMSKANETGVLLANPWIQHYRSGRHPQTTSLSPQVTDSLASLVNSTPVSRLSLDHQDSAGSNAEVVDQNFDESEAKDESSRAISGKKRRTSKSLSSRSTDQVVPSDKPSLVEDAAESTYRRNRK